MGKVNDGGSAFPVIGYEMCNGQALQVVMQRGASLRDYFAAKAMGGMCANSGTVIDADNPEHVAIVAQVAYRIADAMLAARTTDEGEG